MAEGPERLPQVGGGLTIGPPRHGPEPRLAEIRGRLFPELPAHGVVGQPLRLLSDAVGGCYRDALALAGELGMRPLAAHCHLGLGKLYRRTGKREQAQEHLATATMMYRAMDMRFWLEKAEAERIERS